MKEGQPSVGGGNKTVARAGKLLLEAQSTKAPGRHRRPRATQGLQTRQNQRELATGALAGLEPTAEPVQGPAP